MYSPARSPTSSSRAQMVTEHLGISSYRYARVPAASRPAPEHPVLLAIDQQLGESAALGVAHSSPVNGRLPSTEK